MTEDEFKKLMESVQDSHENDESGFDYAGYGILDNLKMSKEELKEAYTTMWDLVMVCTKEERDTKYLFTHGILKSKEIFLERKTKQTPEVSDFQKEIFQKEASVFQKKLENMEALVHFLIKLNEVL
jgi:hypothetical protein